MTVLRRTCSVARGPAGQCGWPRRSAEGHATQAGQMGLDGAGRQPGPPEPPCMWSADPTGRQSPPIPLGSPGRCPSLPVTRWGRFARRSQVMGTDPHLGMAYLGPEIRMGLRPDESLATKERGTINSPVGCAGLSGVCLPCSRGQTSVHIPALPLVNSVILGAHSTQSLVCRLRIIARALWGCRVG